MKAFDLSAIAAELNDRAMSHPIGELQEIRKQLKKHRRADKDIFRLGSETVTKTWACHFGGRTELQFNIGDDGSSGAMLRHGVAFSFYTSRTLVSIDKLKPKVRRFNEFLQLYPNNYASMRMWHWELVKHGKEDKRSDDCMPSPIPPERVKEGIFVFLGKRRPIDQLNYDLILSDFDELLALYRYVESDGAWPPISMPTAAKFAFRPGCSEKAQATVANLSRNQLDVTLRHNQLQEALYQRLVSELGSENVGTEIPCGGKKVDVIVRVPEGYWFYEIKTYSSPRACVREALGQLLEYSFRPGAQEASRLTVVGESPLDSDGEEYLRHLRTRFALPIHYEQIAASTNTT